MTVSILDQFVSINRSSWFENKCLLHFHSSKSWHYITLTAKCRPWLSLESRTLLFSLFSWPVLLPLVHAVIGSLSVVDKGDFSRDTSCQLSNCQSDDVRTQTDSALKVDKALSTFKSYFAILSSGKVLKLGYIDLLFILHKFAFMYDARVESLNIFNQWSSGRKLFSPWISLPQVNILSSN